MNPELQEAQNKVLSEIFSRKLQDWGISMPDIRIDDFLNQNKKACGLKNGVDIYWAGKKMNDFCFKAVQAKNNGNNNNKENKEHIKIDTKKQKELYEALKNYTNHRIAEFKTKEQQAVKQVVKGVDKEESRKNLKTERDNILSFVRAREALKDKKGTDYDKAANKQKIRDAKVITKLTGKT